MRDLSGPLDNYSPQSISDLAIKTDAQKTLPSILVTPTLERWLEIQIAERVVICGVINNHVKYPDGMRILTSSVQGFTSDDEGRSYVLTQNSRYQLGTKLEGEEGEHLLRKILSTGGNPSPELIKLRLRAMNSLNVV